MKIKLTTDYAVRVICFIHKNSPGLITSNQISLEENISHGVLMKVLKRLRESGILHSHQGRGKISGGYTLERSIKTMTVLDIIEIMEGKVVLENIGGKDHIQRGDDKILQEYRRMGQILRSEMNQKSLYEILNENSEEV
jgi:Predicted transcriptional regulator